MNSSIKAITDLGNDGKKIEVTYDLGSMYQDEIIIRRNSINSKEYIIQIKEDGTSVVSISLSTEAMAEIADHILYLIEKETTP
jgi:hypothetical protein